MNTYKISYDERSGETIQSIDVQLSALGYTIDGDILTLFDKSVFDDVINLASFKNWNSITYMSGEQE